MQAWDTWLPDVLPHVEGCPAVIVRHELRRAAQAFFEASRAWQMILSNPLAVAAGQRDVPIVLADATTAPVRAEACWLDGRKIDLVNKEDLDAEFGDAWVTHAGAVERFYQLRPGVISLYKIPGTAASTGLLARISLKPSESSEGLPDDLASAYRDQIALGAKARLKLYAGKSWSDPNGGLLMAQAFGAAADSAKMDAARNFGGGRMASSRSSWC